MLATDDGHTAADLYRNLHIFVISFMYCLLLFIQLTHLSPLNSCLDFSSKWQNSKTSFLSCSSVDSIFTMPFSASPKCYVCDPGLLQNTTKILFKNRAYTINKQTASCNLSIITIHPFYYLSVYVSESMCLWHLYTICCRYSKQGTLPT